ncbi:tRNA (adenosine(37)-N6)-threonylcarbamoyltransferase complex transferase subunit TsaD [candidate division Kazan bacterium]|uniref:tRNA N6-adenosine threonylcarbamoyltransferase n=1 Tax=candidate division Kazan bacterium TaxID=2202143 RepID=A0A420ZDD3_UNCK3|nr:MAG: tRNA (adenosine(37)-N6)-threonylcarbamoyltransferase complex transferase subunit TsaD [candidate division Kazan bacterium]
MKILAIETSCDDTAVAILNNRKVLVSLVASQEKLHANFGGVVPEVASREHLKAIYPLIEMALKKSKLGPQDIDKIAVTGEPGLLGSLLVGVNAAKTLGYLWHKPVVKINHLLGHVYAGFVDNDIRFPLVALVASGGHTELVLVRRHGDYKCLGETRDDAAGEAFDKAARVLGLDYPGGPAIAAAAAGIQYSVSNRTVELPRPMKNRGLDFSFSGLKTAVIRAKGRKEDIAHEFQEAVVDVLATKLMRAAQKYKVKTILLGGGVAANKRLREEVDLRATAKGLRLVVPNSKYCTDNAVMIGMASYFIQKNGK